MEIFIAFRVKFVVKIQGKGRRLLWQGMGKTLGKGKMGVGRDDT